MIASSSRGSRALSTRLVPLLLVAAIQTGCGTAGNQVREARAAIERQRVDRELDELQKAIAMRLALVAAAQRELADGDSAWVELRARQRASAADLKEALRALGHIEEDLAAASARKTAVEAELAPLRALETELAQRTAARAELEAKRQATDAEHAALAAELAELETRAAAKRAELGARLATARQLVEQLEFALGLLSPPAPAPVPVPVPAGEASGEPARAGATPTQGK
ncbi:MAG: hypothetical protein IT457_22750 [Planctomycetes bacterium]|nr:hypothetical protein [Planctomycetota bacterium]